MWAPRCIPSESVDVPAFGLEPPTPIQRENDEDVPLVGHTTKAQRTESLLLLGLPGL